MVTLVIKETGKVKDVIPAIARMAQENPDQTIGGLTCQHCGETGLDVETECVRIYGEHYEVRDNCQDERACWARWDKQNDLTGWNLEVGIR